MFGVEKLRDGAVVFEQVVEKEAGLSFHGGGVVLGVVGAVGFAGGRLAAEIAEVQPAIEKVVHEVADALVGQHALHLFFQLVILSELAGFGGGEQGVIWGGGPEGVGEAGGEVVRLERFLSLVGDLAEV